MNKDDTLIAIVADKKFLSFISRLHLPNMIMQI